MDEQYCPNYCICKLIHEVGFTANETERKNYIHDYCRNDKTRWELCKRLIVKNALNFCPDFVLPDNTLTIDEIIDKFDREDMNN